VPSINDGLFAARAGIQSHGTAIAVLGDNIANQNTVGFKAARADFVDLLAGSLGGGGATSTGSGSSAGKITRILTQGTFESTGRGLDLGIDGNGFFTLQNESGNTYYTRAGNLQVDPSGNLLDQNGYYVMGYPTGGAGTLERLNVNERVSGDIGSEGVTISGNLNAAEEDPAGALAGGPSFEYAELNDGSNYQQQVTIYDYIGRSTYLKYIF
jgi:flagellar hook protein FlgE